MSNNNNNNNNKNEINSNKSNKSNNNSFNDEINNKSMKKDFGKSTTSLSYIHVEKEYEENVNAKKFVIILVGLPARGKSFISYLLSKYLSWLNVPTKIFNIGKFKF
jgi:hypothetical protein